MAQQVWSSNASSALCHTSVTCGFCCVWKSYILIGWAVFFSKRWQHFLQHVVLLCLEILHSHWLSSLLLQCSFVVSGNHAFSLLLFHVVFVMTGNPTSWLVSELGPRGGHWGCPYSTHKNMQDRLDKWRSALTETRLKILIDNHYKTIFESVRSACSSYTMWWRPATTLFPCGTSVPPPPSPEAFINIHGSFLKNWYPSNGKSWIQYLQIYQTSWDHELLLLQTDMKFYWISFATHMKKNMTCVVRWLYMVKLSNLTCIILITSVKNNLP